MTWVLVVVLALVALGLLLRQPAAAYRARRRERERRRKRDWRRQRDAARRQRRQDRAMNPARAAARRGAPRWQQVVQRHGAKCHLCGARTNADDRRRLDAGREALGATYPTVDYVVPLEAGGTYQEDNVRIAHRHCADLRRAQVGRTQFGAPRRTYPA